jgi:RimJ/RimL family protein N-acetyltransferase
MVYLISPITPEDARKISTWTYDPPYDLYSLSAEDVAGFLRADFRYHRVQDDKGDLVGYCCFGEDAHVPGGDYTRGEPEVIDLGIGLRPDLTGRGKGKGFVAAVLSYAIQVFDPEVVRVTIAAFNQRSIRTFQGLGFTETHRFTRDLVKLEFIQLERTGSNPDVG